MIFTRFARKSRSTSTFAIAIALATGAAVGMTAIETPAQAQKKEKEAQPEYSKEFLDAYRPIDEIEKSAAPDYAAAKALVPALVQAARSADEQQAAGGLVYNIGNKTSDEDMRLRGIQLMMDSGKASPELTGQLGFAGYQIYSARGDVANARAALEAAIDANYSFNANLSDGSTRMYGPDDMRLMIADLYFDNENYAEGLSYLSQQIEARKAAGEPVSEQWIRMGLANAYNNQIGDQAAEYAAWLATDYPTKLNWADAVVITLNSRDYSNAETLDLLRLARRMQNYSDPRVLSEYVEVLDPRRYPGEAIAAIDEGYAIGAADRTDSYITEVRAEAASRVEGDRADLPTLAAEARGANADLKTLVLAGDTFLSYDRPTEAEEFYTKALGMSGVERPLVLTRLGIAQYDQGKYAEAQETFGRVEGARRDLANLWAIYASQQM